MPATRPVPVGKLTVNVLELSFTEVRNWMVECESGATTDPLHALAFDDCGLDDIARMCDVSVAALEAYTPTELADLVAACKALNPHFFRVRAALSGVARMMLEEAKALHSTAAPAPS